MDIKNESVSAISQHDSNVHNLKDKLPTNENAKLEPNKIRIKGRQVKRHVRNLDELDESDEEFLGQCNINKSGNKKKNKLDDYKNDKNGNNDVFTTGSALKFPNKLLNTGKILSHWNESQKIIVDMKLIEKTNNIINKIAITGFDSLSYDLPNKNTESKELKKWSNAADVNQKPNPTIEKKLAQIQNDCIISKSELAVGDLKNKVENKENYQLSNKCLNSKEIFDKTLANYDSTLFPNVVNSWFSNISSATKIAASATKIAASTTMTHAAKKLVDAQNILTNVAGQLPTPNLDNFIERPKIQTISNKTLKISDPLESDNIVLNETDNQDWQNDWEDDEPIVFNNKSSNKIENHNLEAKLLDKRLNDDTTDVDDGWDNNDWENDNDDELIKNSIQIENTDNWDSWPDEENEKKPEEEDDTIYLENSAIYEENKFQNFNEDLNINVNNETIDLNANCDLEQKLSQDNLKYLALDSLNQSKLVDICDESSSDSSTGWEYQSQSETKNLSILEEQDEEHETDYPSNDHEYSDNLSVQINADNNISKEESFVSENQAPFNESKIDDLFQAEHQIVKKQLPDFTDDPEEILYKDSSFENPEMNSEFKTNWDNSNEDCSKNLQKTLLSNESLNKMNVNLSENILKNLEPKIDDQNIYDSLPLEDFYNEGSCTKQFEDLTYFKNKIINDENQQKESLELNKILQDCNPESFCNDELKNDRTITNYQAKDLNIEENTNFQENVTLNSNEKFTNNMSSEGILSNCKDITDKIESNSNYIASDNKCDFIESKKLNMEFGWDDWVDNNVVESNLEQKDELFATQNAEFIKESLPEVEHKIVKKNLSDFEENLNIEEDNYNQSCTSTKTTDSNVNFCLAEENLDKNESNMEFSWDDWVDNDVVESKLEQKEELFETQNAEFIKESSPEVEHKIVKKNLSDFEKNLNIELEEQNAGVNIGWDNDWFEEKSDACSKTEVVEEKMIIQEIKREKISDSKFFNQETATTEYSKDLNTCPDEPKIMETKKNDSLFNKNTETDDWNNDWELECDSTIFSQNDIKQDLCQIKTNFNARTNIEKLIKNQNNEKKGKTTNIKNYQVIKQEKEETNDWNDFKFEDKNELNCSKFSNESIKPEHSNELKLDENECKKIKKPKFNVVDHFEAPKGTVKSKPSIKGKLFNVVESDDWNSWENDWNMGLDSKKSNKDQKQQLKSDLKQTLTRDNINRNNFNKISNVSLSQEIQYDTSESRRNYKPETSSASWFDDIKTATKTAAVTTVNHAVKNWSFNPVSLFDSVVDNISSVVGVPSAEEMAIIMRQQKSKKEQTK